LAINTNDIVKKFMKTEFPDKKGKILIQYLREAITEDAVFKGESEKYRWHITGEKVLIVSLDKETEKIVCDMNAYRMFNLVKNAYDAQK
jgi:hypothetical protein